MSDRIDKLRVYLEKDPTDTFTQFALAMEFLKTGQFQHSEQAFKRLIEIDPYYLGAYYHLGKLFHQQEHLELAHSTFIQGLEAANVKKDEHQIKELKEALRLVELDLE